MLDARWIENELEECKRDVGFYRAILERQIAKKQASNRGILMAKKKIKEAEDTQKECQEMLDSAERQTPKPVSRVQLMIPNGTRAETPLEEKKRHLAIHKQQLIRQEKLYPTSDYGACILRGKITKLKQEIEEEKTR